MGKLLLWYRRYEIHLRLLKFALDNKDKSAFAFLYFEYIVHELPIPEHSALLNDTYMAI